MKMLLTDTSLRRPWLTIALIAIVTGLFITQFPKVKFDNDPENMLAEDAGDFAATVENGQQY